jgi:O-antigen/teichoic acid export membrane protein
MIRLFLKFSIGSWLSAAISLFTTPIITALIIPDEFGKASMYTLAFNLAMQLALLGADQGFARKFYKEPDEDYQSRVLFNSILVPFLFSCLIAVLVFVLGNGIGKLLINTASTSFSLLLAFSVIIGVFERFSMLALRMKKKAMSFSLIRVLFSLINFCVVFFYAKFISKDFYAVIYGNFFGLLICTTVAIIASKSLWRPQPVNKVLLKEILVYGFPFLPTFLAAWLFEGIDKMALRQYSTFHEIGLFAAAYKIVTILSILQVAFSTFWTPVAFEVYEKNSDKAKTLFSKALGYMCAALFICGTGMMLFKDVIILLFEKSYHSAASIMPFLLLVPIMYTLSEVTVGGINYRNKTYWHLAIAVIAAVVNYALNMLLVPNLGAKGAAISTGLSYIVFFYSRTYISNYLFPIRINSFKLHGSVLVFIALGLVNTFFPNGIWTYGLTAIAIAALAILYRSELSFFQKTTFRKLGLKPATFNK